MTRKFSCSATQEHPEIHYQKPQFQHDLYQECGAEVRERRRAWDPPPHDSPHWYTPKSNTSNHIFSTSCTRNAVSCVSAARSRTDADHALSRVGTDTGHVTCSGAGGARAAHPRTDVAELMGSRAGTDTVTCSGAGRARAAQAGATLQPEGLVRGH
eukprot:528330-Rhodomonas_salina.1